MSLLNAVRGRAIPGTVALPVAKKLTSLPQIPALPGVGTIGIMREASLPVAGLLGKKQAGAPSSLLTSFGVKSIDV